MSASEFEDIPLLAPEPKTYRQSMLTMADSCPYAAGLYAVGQVPGHPLFRGSILHETFDLVVKTLAAEGEATMAPDDVKSILEEVVRHHPSWVVPAKEWDAMRVMAHHFATHFVLPEGALSEVPYTLEVGGKVCTGTIDLLWVAGNTLHIRDFKTGWNLYAHDDVSGADPATGRRKGGRASQLLQYTLGAVDGVCEDFKMPRGVNHFDVAYIFPMFVTDDGMVERGLTMTRPELIEHRTWLETLVARTSSAFERQRFTAVPGTHCSRCPNSAACPIPVDAKGTGPFERDPVACAMEWRQLDAQVSRMFKELKAYVQEYGPLEVGDQVLELSPVTSSRTPKAAKERVMAGEFVPPDELYVKSVSTRFGLRKAR